MYNCLIVDDEPLALEVLEDYINKVPFLQLKGTCLNAMEAVRKMDNEKIDILFLDIQMPDISGIELLNALTRKPVVIFTTAFHEYATLGYELNVLDYLLKPIPFNRFVMAANKANDYLSSIKNTGNEARRKYIFIRTEYKIVKVNLDDILFVEGLKDYTRIHLKGNARPLITLQALKSLEAKLPESEFIRVHRSYIIGMNHIDVIAKNRVIIHQTEIPISDGFKDEFFKLINTHS